jgi:hypothetical protein
MLDDLMSGEKTKLFKLRDIATILQSSAKSGVRIKDMNKLAVELRKSNEKVQMITLSQSLYGLKAFGKSPIERDHLLAL